MNSTDNERWGTELEIESIVNLTLLFFVYSFLGWCIEVILKYFEFHRFINRGFFTGPLLPIYGSGAALITVAVNALAPYEHGYGTTFITSFALCGTLEYFASYFMEKRFHARWWDYSQKPMNLQGRIWIGNLVLFGFGGVLIIHVLNPLFLLLFGPISLLIREIAAGIFAVVFMADYIVSHFVLKLVKTGVESSKADNTEQISKEVRLLLSDRSVFYRRFADAYPEVIYRTDRVIARMNEIKAETERLRNVAEQRVEQVNQRLEAGKDQIVSRLEPVASIRNSVIREQGELIMLLYDEETATNEMKTLKREIDEDMKRLQDRFTILSIPEGKKSGASVLRKQTDQERMT